MTIADTQEWNRYKRAVDEVQRLLAEGTNAAFNVAVAELTAAEHGLNKLRKLRSDHTAEGHEQR